MSLRSVAAVTDWSVCPAGGGRGGRQAEARGPDHRRERTQPGGRDSRRGRGHPEEEDQRHRGADGALLRDLAAFPLSASHPDELL